MKTLILSITLSSLAFSQEVAYLQSYDCAKIYKQTEQQVSSVKKSDSAVLEIVRTHAQRFPNCLCEIVKAAIVGSEANKQLVKSIVETAIIASPDQLDAIVNCSTAIAPDASKEIAEVASQFTDSTESVAKKSNLLYLNGKNGGGKNGYAGGKNGYGGGKNGYGDQANVSEATEPFSTSALDNLGSGTNFANINVDAAGNPSGVETSTDTVFDTTSTVVSDPFFADPTPSAL